MTGLRKNSKGALHPVARELHFRWALYALALFTTFLLYASLRPFRGWRVPSHSVFDFLMRSEVVHLEHPDVVLNVLGYVPFGFLLMLGLVRRWREPIAIVLAVLIAVAVSVTVEVTQNFLPTRFPSRVDIVTNFMGASIGATLAIVLLPVLSKALRRAPGRAHRTQRGLPRELGVLLIGVWWFAMLGVPEVASNLGVIHALSGGVQLAPSALADRFGYQMASGALGLASAAVVIRVFTIDKPLVLWLTLFALGVALAVRSAAVALHVGGAHALAWISPGTVVGLALGVAIAMCLARLRGPVFVGLGVLILATAVAFANVVTSGVFGAPVKPLPFGDLARVADVAGALWPFAAMGLVAWRGWRVSVGIPAAGSGA